MRGLYKHLTRPVGLGGKQAGAAVHQRLKLGSTEEQKRDPDAMSRFFRTLPDTKSPTVNPAIIEGVKQRTTALPTAGSVPLRSAPTLEQTIRAVRGMQKWKAPTHVFHDFLFRELLNMDGCAEPTFVEHFHAILVEVYYGGEIPQEWKGGATRMLHKIVGPP